MNLLQNLFANAGLPTDFNRTIAKAADAWWRSEMRVLYVHWIRSGWA
jgi:hypothetical protein